MTLSDLKLDVFRTLNYGDSPATAVVTRITAYLNKRHRMLLSRKSLSRLRDGNISFASVAGQATYGLPPVISRIKTIYDGTTNQLKLTERTVQWLRTVDPRLASSGTPESWIPLNVGYVSQQPTTAGSLSITLTAITGVTLNFYVQGVRTGGYYTSETIQVASGFASGTGVLTDWLRIDKWYCDSAPNYDATLATGAQTLGVIPAGQTMARSLYIQLWPKPSSVWTYQVDYTREIPDLVNANDEPLLPTDFHYLLPIGARIDEYEKLDDDRRKAAEAEWEMGCRELENYVINSPDYVIVPGGTSRLSWSNLGSWYPAGSW